MDESSFRVFFVAVINSEMSLSEQEREKSFAKTLPLLRALVKAKWALMSLQRVTGSCWLVS